MISVIIPSYNEGNYLDRCLDALKRARELCSDEIEIIVVENDPSVGRENAKNIGAIISRGSILVFLDADCLVSENFLQEIYEKSQNDYFIGGGVKYVKLSRYSLGMLCFLIVVGIYLLWKQITVGAFWVRRDVFFKIGGFNITIFDDIDFALRLKAYAKRNNKKFESLKKSFLVWSTRKFDKYGDWAWLTKRKQMRDATI